MTTSKTLKLVTWCCKAGLFLLAIGFVLQVLRNIFYITTDNRLFYLGAAFVLTGVLSVVLGVKARQSRPAPGVATMGYPPLMTPIRASSRHVARGSR